VKDLNGVVRLTSSSRELLLCRFYGPAPRTVPQNSLNAQSASSRTAFALRVQCHPERGPGNS
jgi:hypothetical protein